MKTKVMGIIAVQSLFIVQDAQELTVLIHSMSSDIKDKVLKKLKVLRTYSCRG